MAAEWKLRGLEYTLLLLLYWARKGGHTLLADLHRIRRLLLRLRFSSIFPRVCVCWASWIGRDFSLSKKVAPPSSSWYSYSSGLNSQTESFQTPKALDRLLLLLLSKQVGIIYPTTHIDYLITTIESISCEFITAFVIYDSDRIFI